MWLGHIRLAFMGRQRKSNCVVWETFTPLEGTRHSWEESRVKRCISLKQKMNDTTNEVYKKSMYSTCVVSEIGYMVVFVLVCSTGL
jgi:hypothetical protein